MSQKIIIFTIYILITMIHNVNSVETRNKDYGTVDEEFLIKVDPNKYKAQGNIRNKNKLRLNKINVKPILKKPVIKPIEKNEAEDFFDKEIVGLQNEININSTLDSINNLIILLENKIPLSKLKDQNIKIFKQIKNNLTDSNLKDDNDLNLINKFVNDLKDVVDNLVIKDIQDKDEKFLYKYDATRFDKYISRMDEINQNLNNKKIQNIKNNINDIKDTIKNLRKTRSIYYDNLEASDILIH